MSINLPNVSATQFEAEVHQIFQAKGGDLRNSVRVKNVKNAKTHTFNVMGKGQAAERGAIQTPIPLMNVSHTAVTVTVKDYTASEMTEIFKNEQVPIDERRELAEIIANALKRREDQLIIDALVASGTSLTVAKNISGAADNLTIEAIREAASLLDANDVPGENRTIIVHPSGLHHLLANTTVTSTDHVNLKALVQGDLDTFYGFKFIKIADRAEGGLPLATNDRSNFAYHKFSLGLAVNMEPKVMVDWDSAHAAWRITGFLSANAVAIDATGIVKITTDES